MKALPQLECMVPVSSEHSGVGNFHIPAASVMSQLHNSKQDTNFSFITWFSYNNTTSALKCLSTNLPSDRLGCGQVP